MASLMDIIRRRDRESGRESLRREEDEEGRRSQRFEGREGRSRGELVEFDPMEATRETATAVGADLMEDFRGRDAARAGGLNASGLFGSGIGTGRQARDFNERLSNALSSIAQRGAGMRLGQLSDIRRGDIGRAEASRDRELDLISGRRDEELARWLQKKRSSDSRFGAVAGAIGNIAGAAMPG